MVYTKGERSSLMYDSEITYNTICSDDKIKLSSQDDLFSTYMWTVGIARGHEPSDGGLLPAVIWGQPPGLQKMAAWIFNRLNSTKRSRPF